ncbi:MAG TPA: hypothetical protein VGF86_15095, partial [Candidatus Tumulicola sp.]
YASEIQNQEQLQVQSEVFDQMMDERSENMREVDTLRNVDMAQRKMDVFRTIATRSGLLSVARRIHSNTEENTISDGTRQPPKRQTKGTG